MAYKNFAEIDSNFRVETTLKSEGLAFRSIMDAPFSVHGIFFEGGAFRRLPEALAKSLNARIEVLHQHTAGGRVRFVTDSRVIAIHVKLAAVTKMPHFALTGSIGVDLYADHVYHATFMPPFDITDTLEGKTKFDTKQRREITLNLPLYTGVVAMYVGLEEDATLEAARPYRIEKPVVYYGSSITQGGCASRPGAAYESILSRRFDCDHINLGFSGNAKGEDSMAAYIASLDMSAFVLDYDHNAPTPAHLAATHENVYRAVREAHPDIPVLMLTRPKVNLNDEEIERRNVVYKTYTDARANGDDNIYFLDGKALMALCGDEGTVDLCHPTDLGFFSMASAIGAVFEKQFHWGLF